MIESGMFHLYFVGAGRKLKSGLLYAVRQEVKSEALIQAGLTTHETKRVRHIMIFRPGKEDRFEIHGLYALLFRTV